MCTPRGTEHLAPSHRSRRNGKLGREPRHAKSSEIAQLFTGNDSASVDGAKHVRAEQINRPLTIVGTALAAVGILQDKRMNGYTISGFSMLAVSIPFVYAQERALSRAVWWYNAGLPAAAPGKR